MKPRKKKPKKIRSRIDTGQGRSKSESDDEGRGELSTQASSVRTTGGWIQGVIGGGGGGVGVGGGCILKSNTSLPLNLLTGHSYSNSDRT